MFTAKNSDTAERKQSEAPPKNLSQVAKNDVKRNVPARQNQPNDRFLSHHNRETCHIVFIYLLHCNCSPLKAGSEGRKSRNGSHTRPEVTLSHFPNF